MVVLGVPRPGHHGVPYRPVPLAGGARRTAGHRHHHQHPARGSGAAAVLGLLRRLPVTGAPRRGRQPLVLGPHPPLLRPRRRRTPPAAGLGPGLGRAHRRALRRAHRDGHHRAGQQRAPLRGRAVLRRPGRHRRRTQSPSRAALPAPGRGEGARHPGPGMGRAGSPPRVSRASPGQQHLRARAARTGDRAQELLRLRLGGLRRAGQPSLDHHRHRPARRAQPADLPGRLPRCLRAGRRQSPPGPGAGPVLALGGGRHRPHGVAAGPPPTGPPHRRRHTRPWRRRFPPRPAP